MFGFFFSKLRTAVIGSKLLNIVVLTNLIFRSLSLICKFSITIWISRYLQLKDLGIYGLLLTTVTISVFILGIEFHTFSIRELLNPDNLKKRLYLIKNQFILHFTIYTLILPILSSIFFLGFVPVKYVLYFYLILISEHISQELYRIFIALSKPVLATFILFLRTGFWIICLFFAKIFNFIRLDDLSDVMIFWVLGSLFSMLFSLVFLMKTFPDELKKVVNTKTDWKWLKKGIKTSLPFFISSISVQIILFSNRYFIDFYMSKTEVGIFTFYGSICSSLSTMTYSLVTVVYFPKIVSSFQNGNLIEYKNKIKEFRKNILIVVSVLCTGIAIIIKPVLGFINKEEMFSNFHILVLLMLSVMVTEVAYIPHLRMYVNKQDKLLMKVALVGAGLSILLNVLFIKYFGLIGAVSSSLIVAVSLGVIKTMICKRKKLI